MTDGNWYFWSIAPVVVGLLFMALGTLFVAKGLRAKADIKAELLDENVITHEEASIPQVPILDARTVAAQSELIKRHVRERYGRYTDVPRGHPNRDQYLRGLTLRTGLNLAVLGFGVADMAIGIGAITIVLGIATIGFGVPVTYLLA